MAQSFYCNYCGMKFTNVPVLTGGTCSRHPNGASKGKHVLYQGTEKSQYICKYCGIKYTSIATLTAGNCARHPNGSNKGHHEPAL